MHALVFGTPSRTLFAAPYWVAEHIGLFRKAGIEPKLEIIADSVELKDRLRSGAIHISIDTPDTVIVDAVSGGTLRVVAGNACKPPLFIMARPHITSLKELRGASFGVLSLREGSSKLIPRILDAAGLRLQDIRILEVGGAPTRSVLLRDGKIDVGLQPMPLNFQGDADGLASLGWTGQFAPDWQFTTVNVNSRWAVENRPRVVAALAALRNAMTAMQNVSAVADLIAEQLSSTREHASLALSNTARLGILHPELAVSRAGLETVIENLRNDGALPSMKRVELAEFYDGSYLADAARSDLTLLQVDHQITSLCS